MLFSRGFAGFTPAPKDRLNADIRRQSYNWVRLGQLATYGLLFAAAYLSTQVLDLHTAAELLRSERPESGRKIRLLRRQFERGIDLAQDLVTGRGRISDTRALQLVNDLRREERHALDSPELAAYRANVALLRDDAERLWATIENLIRLPDARRRTSGMDLWDTRISDLRDRIQSGLRELSDTDQGVRRQVTAKNRAESRGLLRAIVWLLLITFASQLFWDRKRNRAAHRLEQERNLQIAELALTQSDLKQLSSKLLTLQEDERKRLSRELHDGIGQLLTAIRMDIGSVQSSVDSADPARVAARLDRVNTYTTEAIKAVRNISSLLRPSVLDNIGLEAALRCHAEEFSQRTGLSCVLAASSLKQDLPESWNTCVYRIVQEALHNCEKHAGATRVQILVTQEAAMLSVVIEDDGQGFCYADSNDRTARLGILGMRERARNLGGTLQIDSSPGRGTKVQLRLPIAEMSDLETGPPAETQIAKGSTELKEDETRFRVSRI